ncbi:uncharacterized protein LOC62_01G001066 [Vanrija pseudolonga]|uniref:Transmembrane protein n=1 Tax=Vanrija pseudolonga TaxID=143232 RepID=A0AAF1BFH6_9TREE|nr:hypothetical protein LOC62_01G001066 [Vanrija pseudolonga]
MSQGKQPDKRAGNVARDAPSRAPRNEAVWLCQLAPCTSAAPHGTSGGVGAPGAAMKAFHPPTAVSAPPMLTNHLHTLARRDSRFGSGNLTAKQGGIIAAILVPLFIVVVVLRVLYEKNKRRVPPGEDEVRSTPFTRGEAPASAWFARRDAEAQSPPVPPPPYVTSLVAQPLSMPSPPAAAHLPPSPVTSLPPYRPSAK